MNNKLHPLVKTNLIFLLFFLVFGAMYFAEAFLIPFIFAVILAMLMAPLCRKMEKIGINSAIAAFLCDLLLVIVVLAVGALLSAQIASFVGNLPQIEKQLTQAISNLQQFIQNTFGISPQEQGQAMISLSNLNLSSYIFGFLGSFTNLLTSSLITLVYIFLLLYYRSKFYKFILMVVSDEKKQKTQHVIDDSSHVAQQYLIGRGILILILIAAYSVGLMIVGLKNAIIISVLAALLSIIPYIGNIIGGGLAILMAMVQGGGSGGIIIGILIVFTITQLIATYILEPLVVGTEVDVHPFFTIIGIIIIGLVWGILGMILALPMLAILKIVFSNIDSLHPYAFLIGDTREKKKPEFVEKIKGWFS